MNIDRIGIIGTDALGRNIACAALSVGYRVSLYDTIPDAITVAHDAILDQLQERAAAGLVERKCADTAPGALSTAYQVERLRFVDLIILTAPEGFEMLRTMFVLLDKLCGHNTIFAVASAGLSCPPRLLDLADSVTRQDKFVGMGIVAGRGHLEVVKVFPCRGTSDDTMDTLTITGRRMGMTVVCVPKPTLA